MTRERTIAAYCNQWRAGQDETANTYVIAIAV
jgi:hypothetical protein